MVSGEFELPNSSFGKKNIDKYNREAREIGSEKLRKPKCLEA